MGFVRRCVVFLLFFCVCLLGAGRVYADWEETLAEARGQVVHWYAWGGSDLYNRYMAWSASEVERLYGVEVRHVKLSDTAEAVRQVLAEKSAGGDSSSGAIDVIWINGENFAAMKRHALLFGPFVEALPHFAFVDVEAQPTAILDFTIATDGLEAPWGMAQLIFIYDGAFTTEPPRDPMELLAFAKANEGRITYPAPPDFLGTSFLKQLLILLNYEEARASLYEPPSDANFAHVTAPLWAYLDELTPFLWRQGKAYPKSGQELLNLLDNRDIDIAFSFNVGAVAAAVHEGILSPSARPYVWDDGSIANSHFLAIPYNSGAKAGAQVLINFLLSPRAQARKSDPRHWGEISVLSYRKLDAEGRAEFAAVPSSELVLKNQQLGKTLSEPHPEWIQRIELEWLRRFAR